MTEIGQLISIAFAAVAGIVLLRFVVIPLARSRVWAAIQPVFERILEAATDAALSVEYGGISEEDWEIVLARAEKSGRNPKMEYAIMRAEQIAQNLGVRVTGDGSNPLRRLIGWILPQLNVGLIVDRVEKYIIESPDFPDNPKPLEELPAQIQFQDVEV